MKPPSATRPTVLQRRCQEHLAHQHVADFARDSAIFIRQLLTPDKRPTNAPMGHPLFPQLIG